MGTVRASGRLVLRAKHKCYVQSGHRVFDGKLVTEWRDAGGVWNMHAGDVFVLFMVHDDAKLEQVSEQGCGAFRATGEAVVARELGVVGFDEWSIEVDVLDVDPADVS